jgi:serine/threonine protein kinase
VIKVGYDHYQNSLKFILLRDFGMSHQLDQSEYYNLSAQSKIPVRWSAPELFKSMPYSKKCDVWSFGVTMWEIITNALGIDN